MLWLAAFFTYAMQREFCATEKFGPTGRFCSDVDVPIGENRLERRSLQHRRIIRNKPNFCNLPRLAQARYERIAGSEHSFAEFGRPEFERSLALSVIWADETGLNGRLQLTIGFQAFGQIEYHTDFGTFLLVAGVGFEPTTFRL
jgi:hypothetical protein